jgi:peptidylprolyl isomerase
MDVVDSIQRGEPPASPTKIVQASLLSQNLPRPAMPAPAALPVISADMLNNSKSN